MYESDLSTKHVDPLFGGSLGNDITIIDVSNEDCGGRFPGEDGVALPVGGGADEGLREAWVGNKGLEEVLWGPDKAFFIDGRYVAELGPRPTSRRYQICFRSDEGFAQLCFVFQQFTRWDEARQDKREVASLIVVCRPGAV
jgi:hypothetical protein